MASIGGVPINEFTTKGYFSCAFPTLFPTGAGDFSGQRQNQVTIGNYFKHLMMYDDNRFTKHPRFRFFALNTEMRWRALQTGRVYVKQHPGDTQLSLDQQPIVLLLASTVCQNDYCNPRCACAPRVNKCSVVHFIRGQSFYFHRYSKVMEFAATN